MKSVGAAAVGALTLVAATSSGAEVAAGPGGQVSVRVTLDRSVASSALDGRAYVLVARESDLREGDEPRDAVDVRGIPLWGKDVDGLRPGRSTVLRGGSSDGSGTYGYPLQKLTDLPRGKYVVQAFFNTYETANRSDGSTVKVHFPCGDGGDLWQSPGNLYSTPRTVTINPAKGATIDLNLTHMITPADPVPAGGTCQQGNPSESTHVKHVKIRSAALSTFWGRDVYVAADVLLPQGYDDPANRTVRYPMEIVQGHYPGNAPHRFTESGSNEFSQWWLSDEAPRFISVQFRTENPFYDDSYGVNSANVGPYGDALNTELLPKLDQTFRSIGAPWSRVLTGGSTGGWVSLATQIFYPDTYGGVWSGYPDSLDFHAHQVINLYDDDNAYLNSSSWVEAPRPAARAISGDTRWTMAQENHWELAMGTKGRSMGQWDIWNAVYGPQGADGYPAQPWNKATGAIDHAVVDAWKPMDLADYTVTNWATIGPKLQGKIHVYVGDNDNYFLDNGVDLFDAAVSPLTSPTPDAQFLYGRNAGHGWSPWTVQEQFNIMADYIVDHSPSGAKTQQWTAKSPTAPKIPADATGPVSGGIDAKAPSDKSRAR